MNILQHITKKWGMISLGNPPPRVGYLSISPASLVWLLRLSVDSPHPLAPQTLTPRPLTPHHCVATLGLPRTRHLPLHLRHASRKPAPPLILARVALPVPRCCSPGASLDPSRPNICKSSGHLLCLSLCALFCTLGMSRLGRLLFWC